MAIINSIAIDAGRKSVGNITFRYINGRTIASSKIIHNHSKTEKQLQQRFAFALTGSLAKTLRPIIDIGFEKNGHSSQTAGFVRNNKEFMCYARNSQNLSRDLPAVTNLCAALSDLEFEGRILSADGSLDLAVAYDWGPDRSIEAVLHFSREFKSGDKITLGVCCSYFLSGAYSEFVIFHTKELAAEEVRRLTIKNRLEIDGKTFPQMNILESISPGTDMQVAVTLIVNGKKDRSISSFSLMPEMSARIDTPFL